MPRDQSNTTRSSGNVAQSVDRVTTGSLLGDMYGSLTRVFGGLWTRYGGWGWSRIRTFLPSARFDWEREAGDPWMNSVVALAISWLGDRFSKPLIRVCRINRGGDYVPLPRHDLVDLWNRPNRYYGRRTMEKAIGLSLKCDGNAYVYKVRDRSGKVVELWWIPHYRILPTWPADGSVYIDGYRVWLDVAVYHLAPEDIIHIRDGIDPRNERLGLAALRACLREVVTVNYESTYTASLLKNSGVPGMVIVPKDERLRPTPEHATQIKETFSDKFGVVNDNAGSTAVLMGAYDIKTIGFTPEQMALDKLPEVATSRITAAIGVAMMSLGLKDSNKTYANLQEANKTSWGTIISIQELIGEALRYQLLPEFGGDPAVLLVEYDYANIQELQESVDAVHARAREDFKAGGINRNEFREQVGLEPDDEFGDQYFPGTIIVEQVEPEADESQQGPQNDVQLAASLTQIVEAIVGGQIPPEAATVILRASFPTMPMDQIGLIVSAAEDFEPPEPEMPAMPFGPGGAPPNGENPEGGAEGPPDEEANGEALNGKAVDAVLSGRFRVNGLTRDH